MSRFTKYILFTFITSWAVMGISCRDLEQGSSAGRMSFSYGLVFSMFMPALGALIAGADIRGMGWRLNAGKNYKLILFAWLMPTVFTLTGAALYFAFFPDDFSPAEGFLRTMGEEGFEEFRENSSYAGYLLREIFYSLTSYFTFIGIISGLGEEIGWRGYLFPELESSFGRTKAVLMGGIIHGAWHFPLILLIGYEYGRDYFGAPFLGMPVFCIFTTSTGIISYWLYRRSESIWLPAIIHGTTNATVSTLIFRGSDHAERLIFGPGEVGLIGVIPMALFAAFIVWSEYKREEELTE